MSTDGGTLAGCRRLLVVLLCTTAVVLHCRATPEASFGASNLQNRDCVSLGSATEVEAGRSRTQPLESCHAPEPGGGERFRAPFIHLIQKGFDLRPHEPAESVDSAFIQLTKRLTHSAPDANGTTLQPVSLLAAARGGAQQLQGLFADAWRVHQKNIVVTALASALVFVVLVVIIASILLLQSQYIGSKVRDGIEQYDRDYLGVDVTFENVNVASFTGMISIKNMLVFNPPGYKAAHLLRVGQVDVSIDTRQLAYGCFSFDKVTIRHVIIHKVEIVYEESWTSSNVHDLINFLTYGDFSGTQPATPAAPPPPPVEPEPTTTVQGSAQGKTAEGDQWLTLHELRIEQAQVKLASHTFQDAGVHLQVADVVFKDFNKEMGNYVVSDIIKFVLKSILSTAVSHLASPLGRGSLGSSRKLGCC